MRPVPQIAIDFLKGAEAMRLTAYRDSGGVWTIGVGHTGSDVGEGLAVSTAQAEVLLFADAVRAATKIALAVDAVRIEALSDHQYAALISFAFNLGLDPRWRIVALLNAGDAEQTPIEMMRFDKAKVAGRMAVVPGLFHRRAAEAALWKTPDLPNALAVVQAAPTSPPPSGTTLAALTPPTPSPGVSAGRSPSFLATCATGLCAAAAPFVGALKDLAERVNAAMEPFAGQSTVLRHLQGELTVGLAALAVSATILAWLKIQETKTL